MSTAVEKRMLSLEEIEAQTALVLPERELMHHHKCHHHHHHHHQSETIILLCGNNGFHQRFDLHMNHGHWQGNNGQWWGNNGQWGFNGNQFNGGCVIVSGGEGISGPFGPWGTI